MSDRRKTVLIVDNDEAMRESLAGLLRRDLRVLRAGTGEGALQMMEKEDVDLMVVDVHLPGITGFEVLKIAKENYPHVEVVVISETQEVQIAIEAMRLHAFNYASKDRGLDGVQTLVNIAAAQAGQKRESTRDDVGESSEREFIVGPSPALREIVERVQRIATTPVTVLILGESGTGKELLARLIHRAGGRPDAPFVAVNLAAIPKELVESTLFGHEKGSFTGAIRQQIGKFELASGGTLFLDEVGDLRYELQAKLLRAIQEREIERVGGMEPIKTNLRLIAATNIDLDKAVKEGKFREDLYYRLAVVPIKMPALRDRIEDLPDLARFFLRRYNTRFRRNIQGIAESTMQILCSYWWPGNIRELENMIERLVAVSDKEWITDDELPLELNVAQLDTQGPTTENLLERAVSTFERNFIIRALDKSGFNVTATARALGIPLSTLKFKIDKLQLRDLVRKTRGLEDPGRPD
jgi:two-component system response regulator AtoC